MDNGKLKQNIKDFLIHYIKIVILLYGERKDKID